MSREVSIHPELGMLEGATLAMTIGWSRGFRWPSCPREPEEPAKGALISQALDICDTAPGSLEFWGTPCAGAGGAHPLLSRVAWAPTRNLFVPFDICIQYVGYVFRCVYGCMYECTVFSYVWMYLDVYV
jgi:hypothetical protein